MRTRNHTLALILLVVGAGLSTVALPASATASTEAEQAQVGLEADPDTTESAPADEAPTPAQAPASTSSAPTPAARAAATAGTAVTDVGSAVQRSADAARRDTVLRLTAESSFMGPTGPDREIYGEMVPAASAYGISVRSGSIEGGVRFVDVPWHTLDGVRPSASLRMMGADAVGRYFLPVSWPIMPYLSASAGVRRGAVEISDSRGKASDTDLAFTASLSAGAQIEFGTERVRFGLFTDHGYRYHTGLTFDDARFRRSEARSIDLGTLDLQGYEGRFGLQLGFAL